MTAGTVSDGYRVQSARSDALRPHPARTPRWWRDAVGVATWLSMLVVVVLWVRGGNLQQLGGIGTGVTSLGRLAGFVSADLLLVQVLLMARIPMVERVYGQDELARRHRLVGFWSFNLLLVHLLFTVVGYALMNDVSIPWQTWDMVVNYPGMLLATAGTALLTLVVVTSVKIARARLRYESWHLLHLYAYLGVGLSIPHMIWTGQDLERDPLAKLYWILLWLAALGAVLLWRLGLPALKVLRHRVVVHNVVDEGPGVVSVVVRGNDLSRLRAHAGQFFIWRFVDGAGWTRSHPYSLSAPPHDQFLRITVKDLGDGSRGLRALTRGSRVVLEGPYGRLHGGVRTRRKVTLLASGIGITPMRALLEELEQEPGDVTLVYRASRAEDLVLRAEIDQLAELKGARVYYVIGHRLRGRESWLPESAVGISDADALRQLVPDIADNDVFLCGAQPWMDAARRAALDCGVPAENIHEERFSW